MVFGWQEEYCYLGYIGECQFDLENYVLFVVFEYFGVDLWCKGGQFEQVDIEYQYGWDVFVGLGCELYQDV